jgi:hypothetical protein
MSPQRPTRLDFHCVLPLPPRKFPALFPSRLSARDNAVLRRKSHCPSQFPDKLSMTRAQRGDQLGESASALPMRKSSGVADPSVNS